MAIIVSPLSQAPRLLKERNPSRFVSLLDPQSAFPSAPDDLAHLKVSVHDITEESHGWTAPAREHMTEILDFVSAWDRAGPMLIHCYAGISRSSATAYITACLHNPGADEEEIAQHLRDASEIAWPNRRMVALADAELGRNGRMVRAIERIGEGRNWRDVGENTPFEIPAAYTARKQA